MYEREFWKPRNASHGSVSGGEAADVHVLGSFCVVGRYNATCGANAADELSVWGKCASRVAKHKHPHSHMRARARVSIS